MTLYHAPQELLAWSSNLSGDFAALTGTLHTSADPNQSTYKTLP
jgi:hypothetical protein